MTDGRRSALELLGAHGPQVRERIAVMVRAEHEASVDAQETSGHRSRGVYGEFWRGILEKFEQFSDLPGAALVRPGEAPYRIPIINGVAIFPWRYAKERESELEATPFLTSDARVSATRLRVPVLQDSFDLGLYDPGLSAEELDLLKTFAGATKDPAVTSGKLVVVAISSSVTGLFAVEWGEVRVNESGFVEWVGFHESLLAVPPAQLASTSPVGTFTAGPLPSKFPQSDGSAGSNENG